MKALLSALLISASALLPTLSTAQTVKPYFGSTPDLKVSGNELVDPNGRPVTLHGVMDTPSPYFNNYRWSNGKWIDVERNGDQYVESCKNYFDKVFTALTDQRQGAYCNLFRLHLDPCWTNDPNKQATAGGGENDISRFSADRLRKYLNSLYLPIAENALKHGLYVIIRPPGVFPEDVSVGGAYNQYLLTVWDIVSSSELVKKYPGKISLELGNEPVRMNGNLADFFQPIVSKIRQNGFTGILWLPGTGYQSDYNNYKTKAIQDYNFGYAVHNYPGWYGGWDPNQSQAAFIRNFEAQVPVNDKPIVITEVDWSPMKEGAGHWNETHTQYTEGNFGTWGTGTTNGTTAGVKYQNTQNISWGSRFRALVDKHPNISWTLQGTTTYVDIDTYLKTGVVQPAFLNAMKAAGYPDARQACSGACFDWYKEYACGDRLPMPADGDPGTISTYIPTKYYAPANLTKPTIEGEQNAEYKNGRYYYHFQYSSAFSFYDFQGIRVSELGNLTINCAEESTCGYRLDFILTDAAGNEQLVTGSEGAGTRFTSPQTNRTFDLPALLANYKDYKLDHIRMNTSISADQAANDHDSYFIKVNSIVLGTNSISTPRKSLSPLSKIDFCTWNAATNGTATQKWANTTVLDKALNGGDIIYGENEVGYLNYGDASGYKYMTIAGTPGKTVRVLMNRKVNEGKVEDGNLVEVALTLDAQGIATYDFTSYPYVHINAIKPAWGNDQTTITSIVLVKEGIEPEPAQIASLSDFEFCTWTAPNNGTVTEVWDNTLVLNKSLNGGDIIFGEEKVGYLNYADLSAYKAMTISGTPGKTIRVLFNRLKDEGSVAEGKMEEVDVVLNDQGKATVDLRFYPFFHLNAIKPAWGNDGVTITAIDLVENTDKTIATISDIEYDEWTSANGTKVGEADPNLNLGVELNNYGLVFGTESVSEKFYADLSDYEVLALKGTPGKSIRVLLNSTGSNRVEVNPTFDANGFATVDLTAYPYAHLNAIKVAWGNDVNTAVNSIMVMSADDYNDYRLSQAFASKTDYSEVVTAIEQPAKPSASNVVVARYTINGAQISAPVRGINILRMSDGSVRKIIVR